MTSPIWQTSKDLGTVLDGSPFEKQLFAFTPPPSPVLYQLITGILPSGVTLSITGLLYGTPSVVQTAKREINYESSFTIRATDQYSGSIADRTFNLIVAGVTPATIGTTDSFLGTFYVGDFFKKQLKAHDDSMLQQLSWSVIRGTLPPGINFYSNGLLDGFFYQTRIPDQPFTNVGWDQNPWDKFIYDFTQQEHDRYYEFTVELNDGINYSRQTYTMQVVSKKSALDGSTIQRLPFISTMPQLLPEIKPDLSRQNTYFSFKFDAIGFENNDPTWNYDIIYEITSLDNKGWDQFGDNENHIHGTGFDADDFDSSDYLLPPNLGLDETSGWYVGKISKQFEYQKNYEFYIFARPHYITDIKNYSGHKSKFGVKVLGSAAEFITWNMGEFLGTFDNGKPIEIQINAAHSTNKPLEYKLSSNGSRTPQGVIVLNNGVISGRASIDYFKLDNSQTTIDDYKTTFNSKYTFNVQAQTKDKSAFSEKTFTIVIDYVNKKPFNNLYLKAFPSVEQRKLFEGILNNHAIFPESLIYRLNDPDYGKAKDLRFLFVPGVNVVSMQEYHNALAQNHHTKTLMLGDIKTAIALDENNNIQYEVVYLEIIDEGNLPLALNAQTTSSSGIDLSKINKNAYIANGVSYSMLYPNSLHNMRKRIETQIGYANKNSLPLWMTSLQPTPNDPQKFTVPLGYIPAVVLAYTVPGASNLIAYRIKNSKFNFNKIQFKTDRYQLDDGLSRNYNLPLEKFNPVTETTFDIIPSTSQKFRSIGDVDFAVDVDYLDVETKSIDTFKINATMDQADIVKDGDTVIFYKRGKFPDYVPGWIDQLLIKNVKNHQASIFKITILDDAISLTLFRVCNPGDVIAVKRSNDYKNKELYLESFPRHDTAPHWRILTVPLISDDIFNRTDEKLIKPHQQTTFDDGGVRFVDNRTYYREADSVAKYIKFPNTGVFK
jgi:hypothetical protein